MSVSAHTRDEVARETSPVADNIKLTGSLPELALNPSPKPNVMAPGTEREHPPMPRKKQQNMSVLRLALVRLVRVERRVDRDTTTNYLIISEPELDNNNNTVCNTAVRTSAPLRNLQAGLM